MKQLSVNMCEGTEENGVKFS